MRSYRVTNLILSVFGAALIFLGGPNPLHAQYFGQNKVKYQTFHFKILKSDHFDIYFYPEEADLMPDAARMAERWYTRHSRLFQHQLTGRQPLIIYACPPQFDQTNIIQGLIGEGTGGVTEALKRRIVMPLAGPLKETDHVIGHELVHAFQYDITGQGKGAMRQMPGALQLPLWFIEGMAEYLSLGPEDANTAMWMRDAANHKIPSVRELENPEYFPYRFGQALLAYIGGRWGDEIIGQLLKTAGKEKNIYSALKTVLGISVDSLSKDWHRALHQTYDPVKERTLPPETFGDPIIKASDRNGNMNVSPSISPDGNYVIYFSEKDIFTINLFLADAHTGKILRKIVDAARDPHLESLQFISSTGSWSSDGKRFVFSVVDAGRPALLFLNIPRHHIERKIRFPHIGQILNPSWSPDGKYVVFSAINHGQSDLFLYHLTTDSLIQLTDDPFADLQPAWAPDGTKIAFVSDRFSNDLSDLDYGNYRLAIMDIQSGTIAPLPSFSNGKNINPQWSPNMEDLYFVSDQSGISNLYRLHVRTGEIYQITNVYTGITGITALSPAISLAGETNRLVFSYFNDRKYSIYAIDDPTVLAGSPPVNFFSARRLEMLPPVNRPLTGVLALRANPRFGLPENQEFLVTPYHPKLTLDYVGQPYLAVGASRYGTFLGGGVSLFWSDMLNDHNVATMLQASGRLSDIGGMVSYQNSVHRWNWGIAVQEIPYVTGYYNSGYGTVNGEPVYVEEELRIAQYNSSLAGILAYPFNRAQRVELNASFTHLSFVEEKNLTASSLITGGTILDRTEHLPTPPSLNLMEPSIALVYDQTYFGATSPLLGQRYRFEATPTLGSLTFYSFLADYRRYFMPVKPFTLAARLLHFGRYGKDSEDQRLSPLFMGYQGFLRGYPYNSFSAGECGDADCTALDRLYGSKMLLGNIELRFPLFGALGIGKGFYGVFPLETAFFFDGGVAWTNEQKAWFLGGDRRLVRSAGVAFRVNLGGYFLVEADFVKPFDRPNDRWRWQFGLNAGF